MANAWFRLYAEFEDDPKVRCLPEQMQIRLIWLFCERCKGVTISERHRTFHWRCSDAELANTKREFMAAGFIDEHWNLLNWNKRQFLSDSSTDRTRRYRERHRTSQERHSDRAQSHGNENVTAPDTDTDTDTESEKKHKASPSVNLPEWLHRETWNAWREMRKKIRNAPFTARAESGILSDLAKLREWGIDPNERLLKGIKSGWRGVLFDSDKPSNGKAAYPPGFFDDPPGVSSVRN